MRQLQPMSTTNIIAKHLIINSITFSEIIPLTFLIELRDINIYVKGTKVHTFSTSVDFHPDKFDMTTQDSREQIMFLNSEIRYLK